MTDVNKSTVNWKDPKAVSEYHKEWKKKNKEYYKEYQRTYQRSQGAKLLKNIKLMEKRLQRTQIAFDKMKLQLETETEHLSQLKEVEKGRRQK